MVSYMILCVQKSAVLSHAMFLVCRKAENSWWPFRDTGPTCAPYGNGVTCPGCSNSNDLVTLLDFIFPFFFYS